MEHQSRIFFEQMKAGIQKAGGLFYQYRACRRDAETIYDIENIRRGQVYARTPLQMNDPFDSMIGFSPEKIYDECIELLLAQTRPPADQNAILILKNLLKYRLLGKAAEFVGALNKLKKYLFARSAAAHVPPGNLPQFVAANLDSLYKKCPSDIKQYFDNKQSFLMFSIMMKDYKNVEIEEKTITDILNIEDSLALLEEEVSKVEAQYIPFIKEFLSKLTVACFSASGWDNQLMWAHYANAYAGICVEYDFSRMEQFIGFMYPVTYVSERPALTLRCLGVDRLETGGDGRLKTAGPDLDAIFSYLLSKNKCWAYEDEWRILNLGKQPYTPLFIDAPFIQSVTLGLNIDPICKQLLWDVCQEKGIDCYQLVVNTADYQLGREKLTEEALGFDEAAERAYLELLAARTTAVSERMADSAGVFTKAGKEGTFEAPAMISILTSMLDFLSDSYYLKAAFRRYGRRRNAQGAGPEDGEQIEAAISQLNRVAAIAKSDSASIDKNLDSLLAAGKFSVGDYHKMKGLLANIMELADKRLAPEAPGAEAGNAPDGD